MSYVCTSCGQTHEGLPDIAFGQPGYSYGIPEEEREQRVQLDTDLCVVDEEYYFIRGIVEIPIQGQNETFGIGAWVSQKRENFEIYKEYSDTAEIGSFFGWFANELAFLGESTLNLKTMVHFRGQNLRPLIAFEPTEHALALAQHNGMSLEDAWALVHKVYGDSLAG
jgi:hypothetical protein